MNRMPADMRRPKEAEVSMMHAVDLDLVEICRAIVAANRTAAEWAEVEADDIFQCGMYSGGYDATEDAFCFSCRCTTGELWFQLSLSEVFEVVQGTRTKVSARPAQL